MTIISEPLANAFRCLGWSQRRIQKIRKNDMLFADLGVYGEDIFVLEKCLKDELGDRIPDLSLSVPTEFSIAGHLHFYLYFLPFLRRKIKAQDISISDLEKMLLQNNEN